MTTQHTPSNTASAPSAAQERLAHLRSSMHAAGVDALIVRSTDRYLNEYVPEADSTRQWLSGFTGSMGDALVTLTQAFLCVDGRYHLQADQELDLTAWTVVKLGLAEPIFTGVCNTLDRLVKDGSVKSVGFESARTTTGERDSLDRLLKDTKARLVPLHPSPVEALLPAKPVRPGNLRILQEARVGRTSAQKVAAVQAALEKAGVDLMLVERLDDLAWLTNMRADELPYQATFKGMAAVGRQGALLCFHSRPIPAPLAVERPVFQTVTEEAFAGALAGIAGPGRTASVDPAATTDRNRQLLLDAGFSVKPLANPVTDMKAKKSPEELARMVEAFRLADGVISRCVAWLCKGVEKGLNISEAEFAKHVESGFKRAGAVGLSFKVISAAGANGAVIHYSTPDPTRFIQKGELMLLDTGAYFEEGYATDLTRTFLVGGSKTKATVEQKRTYTLVLKSAIAGMTALVPSGAPGIALDAITRKPLWDVGLTYNHGTGHGVGINVHEAPPSINMRSTLPLLEGQVFSIEPGLYIPGWGGVRIENLCTLLPSKEHAGFLRVTPLTFSPLDARLVEKGLLTASERLFFSWFQKQAKNPV